jgi:DNA-binding HxlR family transcriptional regulator
MSGYNQFCPVARACEVLTDRWTPLVLRELLLGSHHFNELRKGVPLMSRSLLATRLRQLEDAGVVQSEPKANGRGRAYYLTPAGEQARAIIDQLAVWGDQWLKSPLQPSDMDVNLLMWDVHRCLEVQDLGRRQVVVKFIFRNLPRAQRQMATWWLIVTRDQVDLCITNPGHDVAVTLRADLPTFMQFWVGRAAWNESLKRGLFEVEGSRDDASAFAEWLGARPPLGFRFPWYKSRSLLRAAEQSQSAARG